MNPTRRRILGLLLIAAAVWLAWGGLPFAVPGLPSTPPLVVVLYEADYGEPPAYAAGAVNQLRKDGRQVRMIDDDPANGENAVPAEVAPAIEPGRKIMGGSDGKGHALVLLSGERVVKAIALPNSKEAILEASK